MISHVCNHEVSGNKKAIANHRRWCEGRMEHVRPKLAASKIGEKNPMWKGDDVGYEGVHWWVTRHKSRSEVCESCGLNKPLDLANISGQYKRDFDDWEWLCRSCHMVRDGRLEAMRRAKYAMSNL